MDFGEILTKAWKIVWKFKVLWIFGVLASFGQGGGGGGGGGGGSNNSGSGSSDFNFDFNNLPPEVQQSMDKFTQFMSNIEWWMIALFILGIVLLTVIVTVISIVGKNGLIIGAKQADEGAQKLTFGELFSSAMKYFWRVLGFSLLTGLAMFVVILILMLPVIYLGRCYPGRRHALPDSLMCVIIPAFMVIGAVLEQGIIAIVVEDCGIIEGLKRGWMVVKSNFWNIVLMAILLGLITGIIGFIISLPILLAFLPMIVPVMQSVTSGGFDFAAFQAPLMLSIGLCCLIYPFILVANGILVAYGQSAWTLTYLRLTRKAKELEAQPEVMDVLPPAAGAV